MRISSALATLLCLAGARAFTLAPGATMRPMSTRLASTEAAAVAYTKPDRVILDQLPTLYVYDHCPFCVRVRLALGVKNVKHRLHFLANDDIPTPTSLVGKKIAPIFVSRYNSEQTNGRNETRERKNNRKMGQCAWIAVTRPPFSLRGTV